METSGGCLCGEIRYRAKELPIWASFCHCGMCRKATGAPVMSFVEFADKVFEWLSGKPESYLSSEGAVRRFCRTCGSTLTFEMDGRTFISLGSLDHPERIEIQRHCYTRFRLPNVNLADGLPEFEGPSGDKGGQPLDWSPE
ncbi:MAG: GFA family protein [Pseudomonadota bacterium]